MTDKILLINESDAKSIASDLFTFGTIIGGYWLNHTYVGGDGWLSAFLFFAAFMWCVNRGSGMVKRMNPIEARDFLNDKYPVKATPTPSAPQGAPTLPLKLNPQETPT
jgi:hypothetical protein